MFRTSFAGTTGADIFHSDATTQRRFHEHRKLLSAVKAIAYAHPAVVELGGDNAVDHLAASAGFTQVDLVIVRVSIGRRVATIIGVPTRVWRDEDYKARLLELKRDAASFGTKCVLAPQKWIKAEIRGSVSRDIARSRGVRFGRAHQNTVIEHLRTVRISTIAEAAASVAKDHDDPYAVVFSLASQGFVDLDRSRPLRAGTYCSTRL
nr:hypothetical protein [uncultured Devosia sp.]